MGGRGEVELMTFEVPQTLEPVRTHSMAVGQTCAIELLEFDCELRNGIAGI